MILAAGTGTRMKSDLPKVLHPIWGRPMIEHLLRTVRSLGSLKEIIVVVALNTPALKKALKGTTLALQRNQLGSADALKSARGKLASGKGDILVLCGDTPLLTKETLLALIAKHRKTGAACTCLTAVMQDPTGYGRIVRNDSNEVAKLVEEKSASVYEKATTEINVGAYCFKGEDLFEDLDEIGLNKEKKEYYLTDIISVLHRKKALIATHTIEDEEEALGVNSRIDLARAHGILRRRNLTRFMESGVTIMDTASTFIDEDASIGRDTVIYPGTIIEKDVIIGSRCHVGPHARLRPGTRVKNEAEIGNFAELVRTTVGERTKIKHLSYLGDAIIGKDVNIGAGTITANYDGKNKNQTKIGDGAFIGVGTMLIAPVTIGQKARTGAGCVVTKGNNVSAGSIVVGVPARVLKKPGKKKKRK